jgi:RHS repeat-associated protein
MQMPGRKYTQAGSGYRYGFNGQEKSDDVIAGNYTAMYWEYDSRIGRRWNLDPVPKTGQSDYACFDNNPINLSDVDGDDPGKPGKKSKGYDWVSALHYQAIHYNGARIAFNIYKARQQFGHYGTKYNAAYKNTIGARAAKSYKEHDMVITGIDEAAYAKVIQGYYESFEKGFNWAGNRTIRELDFIFKNKLYGAATDVFKPALTKNEAYFAIHQSMALLDDLKGTSYTIGAWGEEVFMKCVMFAGLFANRAGNYNPNFNLQGIKGFNRTQPKMSAFKDGPSSTLDWSRVNHRGETASQHVNLHGTNDLNKPMHGVFNGNPINITNNAWRNKGNIQPVRQANGNDLYVIPVPNAGTQGGLRGNGTTLNNVSIITVGGTNRIVTSFPSQ